MLANSLIMGVITYTSSIIYNLLARKSLETVFYLGLRFLFYTTFMTLLLQLSFYLIKDYKAQDDSENFKEAQEKESNNSQLEAEQEKTSTETENSGFEGSAIDNEFEDIENEGFSALNPEEIDYQQNNNQ